MRLIKILQNLTRPEHVKEIGSFGIGTVFTFSEELFTKIKKLKINNAVYEESNEKNHNNL